MKTWGEKHVHEPERKTGEIRKVYLTNMTSVVLRNNCRIFVADNSQVTRGGNRSKGRAKMPNRARTGTSTEEACHA